MFSTTAFNALGWAVTAFNARTDWVRTREKNKNAKLPQRRARGFFNPFRNNQNKEQDDSKYKDLVVPLLKEKEWELVRAFGGSCPLGLLTLQTTTLHIHGIPDSVHTGKLYKQLFLQRIVAITKREDLKVEQLEIRKGRFYNEKERD